MGVTSAPNSTRPQSRLYPDIFDRMHLLFTQVHLLFDSSAEGHYVTRVLFWFSLLIFYNLFGGGFLILFILFLFFCLFFEWFLQYLFFANKEFRWTLDSGTTQKYVRPSVLHVKNKFIDKMILISPKISVSWIFEMAIKLTECP